MTKYHYFDIQLGENKVLSVTLVEMSDMNLAISTYEVVIAEGENPFDEAALEDALVSFIQTGSIIDGVFDIEIEGRSYPTEINFNQ